MRIAAIVLFRDIGSFMKILKQWLNSALRRIISTKSLRSSSFKK